MGDDGTLFLLFESPSVKFNHMNIWLLITLANTISSSMVHQNLFFLASVLFFVKNYFVKLKNNTDAFKVKASNVTLHFQRIGFLLQGPHVVVYFSLITLKWLSGSLA